MAESMKRISLVFGTRWEAVKMGMVEFVGTNAETIVENISSLLTNYKTYSAIVNAVNPYGNGKAYERIRSIRTDAQSFATGLQENVQWYFTHQGRVNQVMGENYETWIGINYSNRGEVNAP